MTSSTVRLLHKIFRVLDYEWKLDDGRVIVPTEEDLQEGVDKAMKVLYDEPVPSQAEFGGLIVRRKADNKFDIYLKIGNIP